MLIFIRGTQGHHNFVLYKKCGHLPTVTTFHQTFSTSHFMATNNKTKRYAEPTSPDKESPITKDAIVRKQMTFSEIKAEALKMTGGMSVKQLWKQYGIPFAVYYSSLYFGGAATVYLVIQSGALGDSAVIVDWIKTTPVSNYVDLSNINPKYGNLGIAIVINECLEIIRFPFALLTIPYIKKVWDRRRQQTPSSDQEKK